MKRRQFIKVAGTALTIPVALNSRSLFAQTKPFPFQALNDESDRALVLVQLDGGNDGLNTVIPLDQYSNLSRARPGLLIPETSVLKMTGVTALHPIMTGMKALYDNARLGLVQSVGYPNPNRSHFRSKEIWTTASPSNQLWKTGWFGRFLDDQYPGYPGAYPSSQAPDPFAISMGYSVSHTCQGKAGNFCTTLTNPSVLKQYPLTEAGNSTQSNFREEMDYMRLMFTQSNSYTARIQLAASRGANRASYPVNELADQLKHVALLISGGLKTKVYVVTLPGFDTHAGQVDDGNRISGGRHASLLRTLSTAIQAFQDDLKLQGLENKVAGMTFSEFGRQIRGNGSGGTDHGEAAPLLLFGSCVKPQILGTNPQIPSQVAVQDAVPMQYDFRDIYGSVLMDWFGLPVDKVKALLHTGFKYLPVIKPCADTLGIARPVAGLPEQASNFPNPFRDWTTISFHSPGGWARLAVFDARGTEIRVLFDHELSEGDHQVRFDGRELPAGQYFFRLTTGKGEETRMMIRIQ